MLSLLALVLAACNPGASGVVFEEVGYEEVECPAATADPASKDCLLVTATVVGSQRGLGSCVVYASSSEANLFVAAGSGELELEPGHTVRWDVQLERPTDARFDGWNPVCSPMAEG